MEVVDDEGWCSFRRVLRTGAAQFHPWHHQVPTAFVEAVTMYIENAGLSPSHAEIKFTAATCQYFLRVGILRDFWQVPGLGMILLR